MNALWDARTADALGLPWLLHAIAPAGAFGRAAREREQPYRRGDETAARGALARVAQIAQAVDDGRLATLAAALAAAPDPRPAAVRAGAGGVLGDADFFELVRFLDAVEDVRAACGDEFDQADVPHAPSALGERLRPGRIAARTFYLDDAFDAGLRSAREAAERAQTAFDLARSRLVDRVAAFAGTEVIRDGEFTLLRERIAGPLPSEVRVVREAPAYLLCELALDDAARDALVERDRTAAAVADIEERVRAMLSRDVAAAAASLERTCDTLGVLDALVARARFSRRYGCVVPAIADGGSIALTDARHLPLAAELETRGRRYVPISLDVDGFGVVTGPNMGGKSAALRTLGFVTACVALGVPVPASAASVVLVDEIVWLGIGTGNVPDALLSSFGAEVVDLRSFFARGAVRPLVLVDEFARTTSPREGRALLVALVRHLRATGALGLAATHFAGVAADARAPHFSSGALRALPAANGRLDLDDALAQIAAAMDFRLQRVDEAENAATDALALAESLGLDSALVAAARAALR